MSFFGSPDHCDCGLLTEGGGTAGFSWIPAWLSGRGGLTGTGLTGLTGSPTNGGLETRFKEAFLSFFGGHSRFRSFGAG